jgi:hypothetical protein
MTALALARDGFLGRETAPLWARASFHWCHLAWMLPVAAWLVS